MRDCLFLCPTEAELATGVQRRLKPDILFPSVSLLPQFRILERGEQEFLSAYRIHFFADNLDYFIQHAQAKWEVRIHSRHLFMDVSRTYEQLRILRDLIARRFAPRLRKKL